MKRYCQTLIIPDDQEVIVNILRLIPTSGPRLLPVSTR